MSLPSQRESIASAFLATLERPSDWPLSLAGFLVRGGVLAFLLPIVALPTPAGLQVEIAPLLVPFVFGQVSPGLTVLIVVAVSAVTAWLLLGGLVGAWTDVLLSRRFAGAPEDASVGPAFSAVTARLFAHIPLVLALAWGAARIVTVAYGELLTPFEVTTPLAIRVVAGAGDAIAVVVVAWLLGEAAGGFAVREIAFSGRNGPVAAARGWLELVRHPLSSALVIATGSAAVALAVLPALVASAAAWAQVRIVLFDRLGLREAVLAVGVFVALWLGGLVLASVATAFRGALWTSEWLRRKGLAPLPDGAADATGVGTIGGEHAVRPGGWPSPGASGRL